jgi:hypothetical protein
MDFGKRIIVGIKGTKGSGKDTVADMIRYIMAAGTTQASYDNYIWFTKNRDSELDTPIRHFADKLKDDLSIMFGIPRENFDSSEFKDEKYYHFRTGSFIKNTDMLLPDREITLSLLSNSNLADLRDWYKDDCVIKLRTLMQYYGTEVMRNNIGKDVWIRSTINTAIKDRDYYGFAVIADVRFVNEWQAVREVGGKTIHVVRGRLEDKVEHSSEYITSSSSDYEIENNGNLMGLFYKVLEFVKEEMV